MSAFPLLDCPACGFSGATPAGTKSGFALHRCEGCRALFVHPLPASAEAAALYVDAYVEAPPMPSVVATSLGRLVDGAEPWRSEGCWLDIGFGDGSLLEVAAARGWRPFGTEIARPALERARARGFTVGADLSGPEFVPGAFDVVSLVEVVEHVPEARPFLRDAFRMLRPGGLLYVSTPNVRSLNARLLGTAWSVVSPPDHIVLFSAKALRARLAEAGFRVERVRFEGLNPAELVARIRSGSPPSSETYHRQNAAVALAESLSGSPLRRALRRSANAVLSAARAGDTLKVWAVRP
jgi:SAM-dependent methyltransferase